MRDIISDDIGTILRQDLPWDLLTGSTVLVTGANGMLPAYMVETLLALREKLGFGPRKVVALVRNHQKGSDRFSAYLERSDFVLLHGDVNDPLEIEDNVDFIIHAASQATPRYYGPDPVGTISPNVIGTRNILELARKAEARKVLFFSSSEIYGLFDTSPDKIDESTFGSLDPINPRSCYAEGKRAGESLCAAWARQYGLDISIVRPFHTFGPGVSLSDGRIFADFISNIVEHRDIVLKSDGSAVRAFCYISDATEGFFRCLLSGKTCEAYNVGSDVGISVKQLATELCKTYSIRGIKLTFEARKNDGYISSAVDRSVPDISRMRKLRWQPKTPVIEGFKRSVEYLEQRGIGSLPTGVSR